jgi:ubiquinone/menaquinone biosynthesis C-methylase UbiE
MAKDPYGISSKYYDRLLDGMNKGLKLVGIRMFRPKKGMRILDVGCGTGSQLELYMRYQCELFGVDLSPSMLEVARRRLGNRARLEMGDASHLPYADRKFDLVIAMLTLHEMPPATRPRVMEEFTRVVKDDGHILLIDFHTGPYQPLQGWISRGVILLAEIAAGREHFRNYRNFMAHGGLTPLIERHGLKMEKQQVLGGGTFNITLAGKED